jgi:hypothetical protein
MKKLLLFGVLLSLVILSNSIKAGSQQVDKTNASVVEAVVFEMPDSVIDGIPVPHEILMYVQMEYQGYAVTKANKVTQGSGTFYQLLVDNDDQPYNGLVIYLLYDTNWQLVSEQKTLPVPLNPVGPATNQSGDDDNRGFRDYRKFYEKLRDFKEKRPNQRHNR